MKILRYHQLHESVVREIRTTQEQEIMDILRDALDEFSIEKYNISGSGNDNDCTWILWDETKEDLPRWLEGKNPVMCISLVGERDWRINVMKYIDESVKERLITIGYECDIKLTNDLLDLTIYPID